MITFAWKRIERGPRYGVLWELWHGANCVGRCFYLSGSRQFLLSAAAPVRGGVILCDYYAGTAAAARSRLEQDWDKRSIGLFGEDDIEFLNG